MSADRMPERILMDRLGLARSMGNAMICPEEYIRADLHEALLSTIESQGKEIERLREVLREIENKEIADGYDTGYLIGYEWARAIATKALQPDPQGGKST